MTNYTLDTRKLDSLVRDTPDRADQWLRALAQEITDDIKLSFGTSPSPPGGPPGVDTGALRASMHWSRLGHLHYQIADGVDYGADLELIKDRPFMLPMIESWRGRIGQHAREFGIIR